MLGLKTHEDVYSFIEEFLKLLKKHPNEQECKSLLSESFDQTKLDFLSKDLSFFKSIHYLDHRDELIEVVFFDVKKDKYQMILVAENGSIKINSLKFECPICFGTGINEEDICPLCDKGWDG